MIREGEGEVPPATVKVVFPSGTMRTLLAAAKQRAEFRGYSSKSSEWSKGLESDVVLSGIGVVRRAVRPILAGSLGEEAFVVKLGRALNMELHSDLLLRHEGDRGVDFELYGLRTQVKTVQKPQSANLIRVRNEWGTPVPFTSHTCVFCEWFGQSTVGIRGWVWWHRVQGLPHVPARKGRHWNIEVPPTMLQPISALFDEYAARKEAHQ